MGLEMGRMRYLLCVYMEAKLDTRETLVIVIWLKVNGCKGEAKGYVLCIYGG